ncbi:hypothetical protein [Mucilaginibacter agri]|uniref:Outer membrane protein beta-barrel domain-containing protein n=1 Tax=Mucilaginibacter agri TaxID=2695265 RepID=A0A965ZE02_9SPHI|nr:hypothetical protein [Mucilaginibacter agri]NCD68352.1 hypothetical protein [Mucilaginibacter agri]
MFKFFIGLILCFTSLGCLAQSNPAPAAMTHAILNHGQSKKDTTLESDTSKENKEPRYFYASAYTNFFVNTKGGVAKRFAPALEFGRTYGIFDIGIATGQFNSIHADTARFLEFRPTINVFTKGRFSEALCLGAGYVFKAREGLVTEICNSINFNISENVAIAVTQGYCFFDGTNDNRSAQYMGFSFTYNFLKPHSVNKQRKKAAIVSDN